MEIADEPTTAIRVASRGEIRSFLGDEVARQFSQRHRILSNPLRGGDNSYTIIQQEAPLSRLGGIPK